MSASAAASAPHSALGPPLRLGWTILHLALLGSVGFAILIGWMILVATGPVLIVLFGAGLLNPAGYALCALWSGPVRDRTGGILDNQLQTRTTSEHAVFSEVSAGSVTLRSAD